MTTQPPIKYFLAYYGDHAYTDLLLRWNGSGTYWILYLEGKADPLYSGDQQVFTYKGTPNTDYRFRLVTTVDGKEYSKTIITYTTALPAPTGLKLQQVSDSAAGLSWNPVAEAKGYEVCDVTDSYKIVLSTDKTTATFTGLDASTRYSYAVRTLLDDQLSKWSAAVTFSTLAPDNIEPGVYEFSPTTIATYAAGRPGSTDPAWLPSQSNWYHGDGYEWGDTGGVQTTYFFFGSTNPFVRLKGAVVTKCEVFLERYTTGGDPGQVLSRMLLHRYGTKPDGEPMPTTTQVDAGTLARGEKAWVEVPIEWANQLIIGAFAKGWAWGGVPERYQMCKNTAKVDGTPRIGDIRITVG